MRLGNLIVYHVLHIYYRSPCVKSFKDKRNWNILSMHSHLMQIIFGFHYYRFSAELKPIYFRLDPKVKQEQNHFSLCGTYELNLFRQDFNGRETVWQSVISLEMLGT